MTDHVLALDCTGVFVRRAAVPVAHGAHDEERGPALSAGTSSGSEAVMLTLGATSVLIFLVGFSAACSWFAFLEAHRARELMQDLAAELMLDPSQGTPK